MQTITKNRNETFLLNYTIGFRDIITQPKIPVQLVGYDFILTLTSHKNILVNNVTEEIVFKSSESSNVFTIHPNKGEIYINFPMNTLRNNFYICNFYITNPNLSILLNEFQLNVGTGLATGLVKIQLMLNSDNYDLINLNRCATNELG